MQRLMQSALDNAEAARRRGEHDWAAFWMALLALYARLADDAEGRGP